MKKLEMEALKRVNESANICEDKRKARRKSRFNSQMLCEESRLSQRKDNLPIEDEKIDNNERLQMKEHLLVEDEI